MGGAYLQNITGGPESTWCTSVYNWALYCRCKWLCRKLFKSVQRVHEIGITGSMGPQTPVKMITMSWRRLPGGGILCDSYRSLWPSTTRLERWSNFVAIRWQCNVDGTGQAKLKFKLDFPGNLGLAAFAILAMFQFNLCKSFFVRQRDNFFAKQSGLMSLRVQCKYIWWSPTISPTMQSLWFIAQVLWPPCLQAIATSGHYDNHDHIRDVHTEQKAEDWIAQTRTK